MGPFVPLQFKIRSFLATEKLRWLALMILERAQKTQALPLGLLGFVLVFSACYLVFIKRVDPLTTLSIILGFHDDRSSTTVRKVIGTTGIVASTLWFALTAFCLS